MKKAFLPLAILVASFVSCKKDDVVETNNSELITTLRMTFTPVGGGAPQVFEYRDFDGPGGQSPEIDIISLQENSTYNFSAEMFNEAISPVGDITSEIEAEGTSHRVYYLTTLTTPIQISNLDTDANGVTLGLNGTVTTAGTAPGSLRVLLRHYPGNPPGKEESDPSSSSKSSSDLDVTFDTVLF